MTYVVDNTKNHSLNWFKLLLVILRPIAFKWSQATFLSLIPQRIDRICVGCSDGLKANCEQGDGQNEKAG